MKKICALLVTVVMVFSLVGCGKISYSDIVGEWTTQSIDGTSVEEYAKKLGTTVAMAASNMTIKDDDTIVMTNAVTSATYKYVRKSNGIEVMQEGSDTILMSMKFDDDAKTFTYQLDMGNKVIMTIVMKKGTTDLTAEK